MINIFTSLNGVGLQADYELLKALLPETRVYDLNRMKAVEKADISIHLEVPRFNYLSYSPRNIFVPNCEWFYPNWTKDVRKFTEVWAKTKQCEVIFKKLHDNVKFSGFMSKDLYDETVPKRKQLVHIAGASKTKNTSILCDAYKMFPDLPKCFLVSSEIWPTYNNLIPVERLDNYHFNLMINSCMIHICPSSAEGWGHYIHEPMGCGNVVITTDHPPMNEVVTNKDFLIQIAGTGRLRLSSTAILTPELLADKIREVWSKDNTELMEEGKRNRVIFEKECNDFKQFIKENL